MLNTIQQILLQLNEKVDSVLDRLSIVEETIKKSSRTSSRATSRNTSPVTRIRDPTVTKIPDLDVEIEVELCVPFGDNSNAGVREGHLFRSKRC
jgi:hypothetical protein